ncbi:MAG TPA: ATP-binding protein [Albitalea sp.]
MSLQRRLLLYLLICAPLVWGVALAVSVQRARVEVNEMFDTEIIRLALQVQATVAGLGAAGPAVSEAAAEGQADLRDLTIAVWDAAGRSMLPDRHGIALPRRPGSAGFVDLALDGQAWRVYYLPSPDQGLVAAGQKAYERDELVRDLVLGQLLPWLLVLPVLLAAMAWAVRQALSPVRALADDLQRRRAGDLLPIRGDGAPRELQPLLAAMNGLFGRIEAALARERRFTADTAHELRTPLAVLRAQWDVVRRAGSDEERRRAEARLTAGLDRMDRLVTQMLALSRLDATDRLPHTAPLDWTALAEQVTSDVLPLAERRRIELACEWPADGAPPFPLDGDADLVAVLLRNLLDNAVRYAPEGSTVTLAFDARGVAVDNDGPPLPPETLAQLGERFLAVEGQAGKGSGLGISIAQRIAALHGLALRHGARADGRGVVAELSRP